jgi:AcrR family transcriptional regulator
MASTLLPEQSSPKAARILAAAGELLLGRGSKGVTIADVAQKAHVGKGTVYLYWDTKEDLLLGLIGRDFLAVADEVAAALAGDRDLARPSRLCPRLLAIAAEHHFVHALQSTDDGLLGALADDPRSTKLFDTLGPSAMLRQVLPIWRRNHLATTDWTVADQAYALHAVMTGFFTVAADRRARPETDDPTQVLAAAVTALLGPEHAGPDQVDDAAAAVIGLLADQRATVLDIIGRPAVAPPKA